MFTSTPTTPGCDGADGGSRKSMCPGPRPSVDAHQASAERYLLCFTKDGAEEAARKVTAAGRK